MFCCPQDAAKPVESLQEDTQPAAVPVREPEIQPPAPEPEPKPEPVPEPPAPEPVKEAAPKPTLTIEFDVGTASITERPIGVSFENKAPLQVKNVEEGAAAGMAGVKPGWVFKKIGGQPVDSLDYEGALKVLKEQLQTLPPAASDPPGSLVMKFLTSPGVLKKVVFTRKPLGMAFDKKLPMTVKSVPAGGHAEQLGVKPGWEFRQVQDQELSKKTADEIARLISTTSATLPSS